MIKAKFHQRSGRALILLGLSEENLRRLREDQPILVRGADVEMPDLDIAIVAGRTEEGITQMLKDAGWLP